MLGGSLTYVPACLPICLPAWRRQVVEFLRRVLKLAAIRLADLLSRLDIQPADPQLLLAEVRPYDISATLICTGPFSRPACARAFVTTPCHCLSIHLVHSL